MTGSIFINYRRIESLKDARHLATLLEKAFGSSKIFIDLKGLDGSSDWLHELERQVARSGVMVSVIGKGWADTRDGKDRRRIDDDNDFVRFEIAEAFRRDIPVVPILVDGASMPSANELPQNLLLLTRPQAELLRTESFEADVAKIALRIRGELIRRQTGIPTKTALAGTLGALAIGLTVGALLLPRTDGFSDSRSTDQTGRLEKLSSERDAAKKENSDLRQSLATAVSAREAAEAGLARARADANRDVATVRKERDTLATASKATDASLAQLRAETTKMLQENWDLKKDRDGLAATLKLSEKEGARRDAELKELQIQTSKPSAMTAEAIPAGAAPASAMVPPVATDMFDVKAVTRSIQAKLRELQCFDREPTGVWGPVTSAAIGKFNAASTTPPLASDRPTKEALTTLESSTAAKCQVTCKETEVLQNGQCAVDPKLSAQTEYLTTELQTWRNDLRSKGCFGRKSAQVMAQGWWPFSDQPDMLLNTEKCKAIVKASMPVLSALQERATQLLVSYDCLEFFLFSKTLKRTEKCIFLASPYDEINSQMQVATTLTSPPASGAAKTQPSPAGRK